MLNQPSSYKSYEFSESFGCFAQSRSCAGKVPGRQTRHPALHHDELIWFRRRCQMTQERIKEMKRAGDKCSVLEFSVTGQMQS
jgi:hypothetical protein